MAAVLVDDVKRDGGAEIEAVARRDFRNARLPRYAVALLRALRFDGADCEGLEHLDTSEWQKLLALCDASQLTLLLRQLCRPSLPDWVRARVDSDYSKNGQRFARLKAAVFEIANALSDRSITVALLKGFSHSPDFTPDPLVRAQGDIDLWCPPDVVLEARDALLELGYRPIAKSKGRHLDPMIRETDWQWRGDYFAVDLPIPVDLHFELWDKQMEGIDRPPETEIWGRCRSVPVDGQPIRVLDLPDVLAFAALHFMMHLLHGDVRLHRGWELACFLQNRADDEHFWARWRDLYDAELRTPQVVAFALSAHWFGCRLPPLILKEIAALPEDVLLWISHYGASPVEALFVPNKDEVWLHLSLLHSFKNKARVLSRRLLPLSAASYQAPGAGSGKQQKSATLGLSFLARRARHHAITLPLTCVRGFEWWWRRLQLGRDFWIFLSSSVLFDFGEFVFFLLYNLYLLDLGYNEKFLGQVSGALTAGTFVGLIPAASFARRFGTRNAVFIAIVATAAATTLRAAVVWQPALIASAFLNGLFMSFWAVSLPPAVASLTTIRNRTFGFSLITSMGIGIGTLAGLIGGRLPALLMHFHSSFTAVEAKRVALLAGSGFAAFAVVPALFLRLPASNEPGKEKTKRVYPRGRFTYVFFAALFVCTLGTGGFNPFFNAYFSRSLHFSVEKIGLIFSYGQLAQVIAILAAPAILKRVSEVPGIAAMQVATAAMLACLALVTSPVGAVAFYVAYMCFQYMSEPCLLSMLMTRVSPSEQSGASALHFMVMSLAGICAAMLAGAAVPHVGYGPTLMACAAVTLTAAGIFYCFLRR
jgi:predicted MFS family arabinose efflux permease